MSGWGSGYPGVPGDAAKKKAEAAENAPVQDAEQASDEAEDSGGSS